MKRWLWMGGAAGLLLLVCLALLFSGRQTSPKSPSWRDWDAGFPGLPDDERAAHRELHRARRALQRLQPSDPYVVIDTHANYLYLRTANRVLIKAACSTGSGGELVDSTSGRRWVFDTPRGLFRVDSKIPDPWWRKPDWAFIEEHEKVPRDSSQRFDPRILGEYALGFGDGYFIHGTIYESLLGINVTHGCVRLGTEDLRRLYERVQIGSPVYIF